jgi:RNA polymerase sigma factor (sigma-70 family)
VKPLLVATATETADEQLVAAVREGSEEAFEALYRRYRPRIVAYVRGMVSDHARAEDIAQEAFMSALRGLRTSQQDILFRPWMFEIAKNACIDHLRRARRGTEVSIDSDDFSPQEEGRISQSVSGTDAEVARREKLESLQMAFGDLPKSQHRILVMRELEGLSYDRIGSRMGLSRGAVESQLFRARRTLRDGFDDIDTGARCVRMRLAMEATADGRRGGLRERRRLTTHLRACAACRRTAVSIGLDELALAAARDRGSAIRRLAGLLPLPAFLRRRVDDGLGLLGSMGPATEQGASLAAKATAVVLAAAIAAGGAGVATRASGGGLGLPGGLGGSDDAPTAPGHRDGASGSGGGADAGGTTTAGPGGSAGAVKGHGEPGAQRGRTGGEDSSGDAGGSGTGTPAGVDRTAGSLSDAASGIAGSLAGSTGEAVNRTTEGAGGLADQTLQDVTGGLSPRLPEPQIQVPDTGVDLSSPGDGTSTPGLPDVGGALGGQQLPVQTPGVNVPQTGISVPSTGVRLP